ncbi:hypothetical protein GCM10011505_35730 [Tistrella bauzanensis]|uniref:Uncharacterized protein n=1 Tax=Tistrella bauzanensis TaxID=657419 RepID=A0ABQ1ISK8_9PROT|nr:hypothetical protein [Tistrella bauzanensis]GGB51520.1 hypothetical protein GCM10011505_35730 [Tistrella bauzanensis]
MSGGLDRTLGRMLGDLLGLAGAGGLAPPCRLDRTSAAFDPETGITSEARVTLATGRLIWGRDPVAAGIAPDLATDRPPRRPAMVEGLGVTPTPGDILVIDAADWRIDEALRPVPVLDLWRLLLRAP